MTARIADVGDALTIPATHDANVRELVARSRALRRAHEETLEAARRPEADEARAAVVRQLRTRPEFAPHFTALAEAGIDLDARCTPDHDDTLATLRRGFAQWTVPAAAEAFVASLWSAPVAWRSALPGMLLAKAMPDHAFSAYSANSPLDCGVCGFQKRTLQLVDIWDERLTAGIPLDGEPVGYALASTWFAAERPRPAEYDLWALGALRAVIQSLPSGTRYSAVAKAIKAAKILRGPRTPLDVLEALALSGVLAAPERPGMAERFTTYRERDARPNVRVEVQAPLAWWDTSVGDRGIRGDIFDDLFGDLDIPTVSLDDPRPKLPLPAKDTIEGGVADRVRALSPKKPKIAKSVGEGPAAAGDVWTVRRDPNRWFTFYVHDVREDSVRAGQAPRPYAYVELLTHTFSEIPAADDLSEHLRLRAGERVGAWAHSLEKTPWVRRIDQNVAPPVSDEPRPRGEYMISAAELQSFGELWLGPGREDGGLGTT